MTAKQWKQLKCHHSSDLAGLTENGKIIPDREKLNFYELITLISMYKLL